MVESVRDHFSDDFFFFFAFGKSAAFVYEITEVRKRPNSFFSL